MYMYIHIYIRKEALIYFEIYTHVYIYMYIYIYTHTHLNAVGRSLLARHYRGLAFGVASASLDSKPPASANARAGRTLDCTSIREKDGSWTRMMRKKPFFLV